MTLAERVARAGNAIETTQAVDERSRLARLRSQIAELVSVDDMASLARSNPEQARSEVRRACRTAMEASDWAGVRQPEREHLESRLIDSLFGYGLIEAMLSDPGITEVMVNGTQSIYVERDGMLSRSGVRYESESELRALIDRILGPVGRRVDEAAPMVSARLPQGYRVNVVMPPIALCGPVVTIRKFSERVITLADMEASGSVDGPLSTFLRWAVLARRSIAVSGGTGSGKTTLLNALSCVVPATERIVTIEDSAELRFLEHPHVVGLEARPRNAEGLGEVTIRDLVANALRMRPDRIIVGECRGAEALDMLQAMTTGHEGSLTTLHANSPQDSIARLATMVRFGADLPVEVIEANIASAIDLVVQTRRLGNGRRMVSGVAELRFDRERGRCEPNELYARAVGSGFGVWAREPAWVAELPQRGLASKREVDEWRRACCLPA